MARDGGRVTGARAGAGPAAVRPVRAVAPRRRGPARTSPADQLRVSVVFVLGVAALVSVALGASLAAMVCAAGALAAAATVRRSPMTVLDRRLRAIGIALAIGPGLLAVMLAGTRGVL